MPIATGKPPSSVALPEPEEPAPAETNAEGVDRANQSTAPRINPPRAPGFLLLELGYLPEPEAAEALDLSLPTLVEYRKKRKGPPFTIVGRKILYGVNGIAEWLANGGTREPSQQ
jgi:hypothetical protein